MSGIPNCWSCTLSRASELTVRRLAALVALLCAYVAASDGGTDQPRVPWVLPVTVPAGQSAETQAFASELSAFLGQKGKVITAPSDVVACFWVEVKASNPPEGKGFLLNIESAGARLTASDLAALNDAFDFLKSLAVKDRKSVKLAAGKFTTVETNNVNAPVRQGAKALLLSPRNDILELPNFAKVTDQLYRGGQPEAGGFRILKQMGVKTVIDLCANHSDRKRLAGLGLRYAHLSCEASHPDEDKAVQFLKILSNPANHPVFVHCHRGADRTGMMAATYRIVEQGWSVEDAIAELPRFKFGEGNKLVFKFLRFEPDALRKKVEQSRSQVIEIIP